MIFEDLLEIADIDLKAERFGMRAGAGRFRRPRKEVCESDAAGSIDNAGRKVRSGRGQDFDLALAEEDHTIDRCAEGANFLSGSVGTLFREGRERGEHTGGDALEIGLCLQEKRAVDGRNKRQSAHGVGFDLLWLRWLRRFRRKRIGILGKISDQLQGAVLYGERGDQRAFFFFEQVRRQTLGNLIER